MKFVITGAAGHVSKPLALQLLHAGHSVTTIGRNADHLAELALAGASMAIGSVEDRVFINNVFAGADAVYTMCPPAIHVNNLTGYCEDIATNYAESIAANRISYVVNLSSVGAHMQTGAGHITGMHRTEAILNQLENVNIRHLRPVFFLTNLFANIDLIKNMGIMGNKFCVAAGRFPVVYPGDIARVAYEELTGLNFRGHSVRYVCSDETGTDEIAEVIGKAIGKPGLKWVQFSDEQFSQGLMQSGFSKAAINDFIEGFNALNSGKLFEDYWIHSAEKVPATTLEDFAAIFAGVYHSNLKSLNKA